MPDRVLLKAGEETAPRTLIAAVRTGAYIARLRQSAKRLTSRRK